MSKEELAGGASLDAMRPRGWAWRLWTAIVAKVTHPGPDTEWEAKQHYRTGRVRMTDGAFANPDVYMQRVRGGRIERRRATPEEVERCEQDQADREARFP